MSDNLRFSIEESVWFQKGEEIDDVLSVSLEPDIVVDEYGEYVSVRGTLQLKGEFRPYERKDDDSNDEDDVKEQLSNRFVQEVTRSDNGTAFFQHRFPVDITIPISRVSRLDDIYIQVESFDYRLPNQQCLQLTADLEIIGIQQEEFREKTEEANKKEEQQDMTSAYRSGETSFEVEVKQEMADTEQVSDAQEEGEMFARDEATETVQAPQIEMKGRIEEEEKDELSDYEEDETVIAFAQRSNQSVNATYDIPSESEELEIETVNEDESIRRDQVEKTHRNENALYLTKMLTREEEKFSKLKMRIIQPGDSLDSIAERYEVPPSYLVKINKLEQEEVEEGQILYIPVSAGN